MGTRSLLRYFLNRDEIEILKIILSTCFVNISDGDKIPIEMPPCLANISNGDKIPIDIIIGWGQDKDFENYIVPMLSKYF